jgi:hypothetical protein
MTHNGSRAWRSSGDRLPSAGPAIEAHYQFLAWLAPTIEKFPKSHKYTLGDRIQTLALDVLEP